MDLLDRLLDGVNRIYLIISQVLLGGLVVGILTEVVLRYFLGRGILGSGEITRLAVTWIVFLMAAVLYRRRRHIVVSALVDVLPLRWKHVCDVAINVSVIVLSGYVLFQLYQVWEFLGLRTPVFGIPDPAFKVASVFCFVPIALQSVVNLSRGVPTSGVQDI